MTITTISLWPVLTELYFDKTKFIYPSTIPALGQARYKGHPCCHSTAGDNGASPIVITREKATPKRQSLAAMIDTACLALRYNARPVHLVAGGLHPSLAPTHKNSGILKSSCKYKTRACLTPLLVGPSSTMGSQCSEPSQYLATATPVVSSYVSSVKFGIREITISVLF